MDCAALIDILPSNEEWAALPNVKRKSVAEDFIGAILVAIEQDEREPDLWEAGELCGGIGAVAWGMYDLSLVCSIKALTPIQSRSPAYARIPSDPPQPPSIRQLRAELDRVRSLPTRVA